jgi:kynurenine formamidase
MQTLWEHLCKARSIDLAQPWFVGMPHYPTHPPFLYSLTKQHGEITLPGGGSAAADAIAMGTHVGTHLDALCHFSCCGKMFGGIETQGRQSYATGVDHLPVSTVQPIVRRGVLLDIAGLEGRNGPGEALGADFAVTSEHLEAAATRQGVSIGKGDIVLLRTGWARFWDDPARYINNVHGPGPQLDGARWLSSRGIFAAGSDTVAFERVPSPQMEVHIHLLVENGIHIIEALNLEQLAEERAWEFVFVGAPLKLQGATGSPMRPFALLD